MSYRLTIIIPVYNEVENLLRVEQELIAFFDKAVVKSKVLFVNDGSTDGSLNLIKEICDRTTGFEFLSFSKNEGLSAALKAGFDHTITPLVGYIDADLQTHPEDFNLLLDQMGTHTLITGIRENRQDNWVKRLSSKLANRFRRIFTKDGIDDSGCPLKVIQTNYAKRIPMFDGMHRFLPALILLQEGTVKQVPVRHFPRKAGESKFGFRNRWLVTLVDCVVFLWIKRRYLHYSIQESSDTGE